MTKENEDLGMFGDIPENLGDFMCPFWPHRQKKLSEVPFVWYTQQLAKSQYRIPCTGDAITDEFIEAHILPHLDNDEQDEEFL